MEFKRAGFLTKIVVLALLIYMATSLLELRGKIQEVQAQRDELTWQVTSDDPEMLERVARDRGYVEKDETLFIDVAN